MIRHEKNSPYEVPEGTELPIYICACGLRRTNPFATASTKKRATKIPPTSTSMTTSAAPASKPNTSHSSPPSFRDCPPSRMGRGLGVRFLPLVPEQIVRADSEPTPPPSDETSKAPPDWLRYLAEPRHAVPILLIVGVALYLVNLGGYPFYTKGEPREAVTVFDIVHGGGVILPQRAGVEIPSKPLLMHWLAALFRSSRAASTNTVRLPSASLAIAGMIVCYLYVRRMFDDVTAPSSPPDARRPPFNICRPAPARASI